MTDIHTPPRPATSASPIAAPARPQFSVGSKTFVALTSFVLFCVTFFTTRPNPEPGLSNPITEAAGRSAGAVLFAVAIAFGAYKGVKPSQPKVFLGVFSASVAFVLLSVL